MIVINLMTLLAGDDVRNEDDGCNDGLVMIVIKLMTLLAGDDVRN